ncbi:MAG: TonB family protein [Gemmatimonadota bacterium]|nr:TonB family protein [Gemmatimonadota bacterium]
MQLSGILAALLLAACTTPPDGTMDLPAGQGANPDRGDDAPVPLDAQSPVEYPSALFDQAIGGTVVLRLFVTETGAVVPESTRVQESSGYPALDSAALAAAPKLRYAPATRDGAPVAAPFTQPIIFRAPGRGGITP